MENELSLVTELENAKSQIYCTLDTSSDEGRMAIYNASENATGLVKDNLNKTINLKDLFIQKYSKVDETTGEFKEKTRTILIDDKGNSYASASTGLFNSLKKLLGIMGTPDTWTTPLPIQVVETKTKNGNNTYTIKIVK